MKEKVKQEIYKSIDDVHYEAMPKLSLSSIDIHFENVRYKIQKFQNLMIENAGNSFAIFEIKEYNDLIKCKSWISIVPVTGSLSPGESTELSISVFFGKHQSRLANKDQDYLSLIFVLSIIGGSDYFVIFI